MTSIRILIVDDHPLFLEGIATVIAHAEDMELAGRATSGRQAVEEFKRVRPDITLMDLRLPDMSGIAAVTAIRAEFPDAKVIMLTTFEGDVEIQRALAAGVRAYLLKSAPLDELVQVIRKVHSGRKHLPAEVAENLVGHLRRRFAERTRGRSAQAHGRGRPQSRHRRAPGDFGRNRQGPHPAHHGQARREGPHAGRGHRCSPRSHSPVIPRKCYWPVTALRVSALKLRRYLGTCSRLVNGARRCAGRFRDFPRAGLALHCCCCEWWWVGITITEAAIFLAGSHSPLILLAAACTAVGGVTLMFGFFTPIASTSRGPGGAILLVSYSVPGVCSCSTRAWRCSSS